MVLGGQRAMRVRHEAASLLVRRPGGTNRKRHAMRACATFLHHLPGISEAMSHLCRMFCTTGDASKISQQALPNTQRDSLEKLSRAASCNAQIGLSQRRPAPYALVNNDQPLSIPGFLLQKERGDSESASVRRQFTPAFGVLVNILRQDALKAAGRPFTHKKNASTEPERPVMEQAWLMTGAYRESLLGRRGAVAPETHPNILQML